MASTYKNFQPNDQTSTRTLLHESVPMTGTLMSGTYGTFPDGTNIKTYTHGMFESVYDYPHLSSSANHIFDIAVGYAAGPATASLTGLSTGSKEKRVNIYNSMAQVLMGFNKDANLRKFDEDGDLTTGSVYDQVLILNFARLLYKDEIKKGSFTMDFFPSGAYSHNQELIRIGDYGAATDYKINSPAGDFGVLYVTQQDGADISAAPAFPLNEQFKQTGSNGRSFAGLIYYQAGIAVFPITCTFPTSSLTVNSIFGNFGPDQGDGGDLGQYSGSFGTGSLNDLRASGSTNDWAANFRQRVKNISFNNTTELNSSVYFCRVNHNDFNYSSNKSYLSASKIRVKNDNTDTPVSYLTTVGLYDANSNLMATAKLSEPIKKTPDTELVLRVRLDY